MNRLIIHSIWAKTQHYDAKMKLYSSTNWWLTHAWPLSLSVRSENNTPMVQVDKRSHLVLFKQNQRNMILLIGIIWWAQFQSYMFQIILEYMYIYKKLEKIPTPTPESFNSNSNSNSESFNSNSQLRQVSWISTPTPTPTPGVSTPTPASLLNINSNSGGFNSNSNSGVGVEPNSNSNSGVDPNPAGGSR